MDFVGGSGYRTNGTPPYCRKIMVRCVQNLVDIYVFVKLQIFNLADILRSSGSAWDLILAAFRVPGAAFSWSGRVLGIYCNIAALAGRLGGSQNFGNDQI